MTLPFFCFLLVYCLETLTLTLPFFILLVYCLVSAFRVFSLSFCAGLPCCCAVLYCVCVRGGGVRSPGEVGVLVHPPLGKCVKALCYSVNGGSALHSAGFTSPKTKKHRVQRRCVY